MRKLQFETWMCCCANHKEHRWEYVQFCSHANARLGLNSWDNVQITGCGADVQIVSRGAGLQCRWEGGVQVCSHAGASASWVRLPSSTRPRCKRRVPAQHGARVDPPRQSVTRRDSGSVGLLPSQTGRDASFPGVSSSALWFERWLIRIALSKWYFCFPVLKICPMSDKAFACSPTLKKNIHPLFFLSFNCPALPE